MPARPAGQAPGAREPGSAPWANPPPHPKRRTRSGQEPIPRARTGAVDVDAVVGGIADQAVAIDAEAIWLQLGVIDRATYGRTREAGLLMVMDFSPRRELPRLALD
ncbi:CoA-binding protein [Streptomyces sp. NBC_00624]|uniref:CoA-binding protein n=1 Tax=unclassified Streptomyces TaxID=2593676 RepID=UPI00386AEF6C